jgi:hypothetical protein
MMVEGKNGNTVAVLLTIYLLSNPWPFYLLVEGLTVSALAV